MSDLTFSIDTHGNVSAEVTQGARPNVTFKNDSDQDVTVSVTGVPGTRPFEGQPPPNAGRLFSTNRAPLGGGETTFTVPANGSKQERIGPFPVQGTYLLSTGDNRRDLALSVHTITITVEPDGKRIRSGEFEVTQGAELPVDFVNFGDKAVAVLIMARAGTTADAGALFRTGPNSPILGAGQTIEGLAANGTTTTVTILEGQAAIRVPAKQGTAPGTARATISANAPLGNFTFAIPGGDPCNPWINVHGHMT